MQQEHWSGEVGGRPVAIRIDQDHNVVISTVLAEDEEQKPGDVIAARKKGEPIELQADDGETYEQVLLVNGFTAEQAAEIESHLPRVLDAE